MYGLNAVAFVFFGAINISAYQLCKCSPQSRTKVIRLLCLVLLIGNILRYTLSPLLGNGIQIPVEFSTVAYFVVPVILLIGKQLQSWAAYSGLMAGFFYYMAMIVAGGTVYSSYQPYDIYISLFCHGSIYLCGFVTAGTQRSQAGDGYRLAAGVAYVSLRALLIRPIVVESDGLLIYMLLDGAVIKNMTFLSQYSFSVFLPFYYIVITLFVLLTIKLYFRINEKQYVKFSQMQSPGI